jgi:hypothetical protein
MIVRQRRNGQTRVRETKTRNRKDSVSWNEMDRCLRQVKYEDKEREEDKQETNRKERERERDKTRKKNGKTENEEEEEIIRKA